MPQSLLLRRVPRARPVCLALAMVRCMVRATISWPMPPSPSTTWETGVCFEHLQAGGRVVATGLEVSGVPAESLEAVGVDAAEVGGELDLDGELGVV